MSVWQVRLAEPGPPVLTGIRTMFTISSATVADILVIDIAATRSRDPAGSSALASRVFAVIEAAAHRKVLLDLRGLPFISSDIIGQLIMLQKKCQAHDRVLKVCGVSEDNKLALDLVRFDRLVDIYEHKPHAIVSFKLEECGPPTDLGDLGKASDYLAAAESGDAEARFRFGKCLEAGRGVEQDFAAALEWYHKAAELGHLEALHALAVAHAYGIGVPQDFDTAFKWYKRAADHGHPESLFWVGVSSQYGLIDDVDVARAIKWYTEAAEQGYKPAHAAIAELRRN